MRNLLKDIADTIKAIREFPSPKFDWKKGLCDILNCLKEICLNFSRMLSKWCSEKELESMKRERFPNRELTLREAQALSSCFESWFRHPAFNRSKSGIDFEHGVLILRYIHLGKLSGVNDLTTEEIDDGVSNLIINFFLFEKEPSCEISSADIAVEFHDKSLIVYLAFNQLGRMFICHWREIRKKRK